MAQPEGADNGEKNVEGVLSANSPILNPFNSGYGMGCELVFTVGQIIACVVILAESTDEKPHKPLRAWVVAYICACAVSIPLLYWRYRHQKKSDARAAAQANQVTMLRSNSFGRLNDGSVTAVECIKWVLDCFFLAWFIVGCVWLFKGTSSKSDAPNLYGLVLAVIIIYSIGYALRMLCFATACCFVSCLIALLGFGMAPDAAEDAKATAESAATETATDLAV